MFAYLVVLIVAGAVRRAIGPCRARSGVVPLAHWCV